MEVVGNIYEGNITAEEVVRGEGGNEQWEDWKDTTGWM